MMLKPLITPKSTLFLKFFEYIKTLDLTYEELVDLVITFKTELIVLTKEDINIEIDKAYVKKKGGLN